MNPINPVLFRIGPFAVAWYGVLIMTGVGLGAYFSSRLARKRGLNPDHVWGGLVVAVVIGILGARLYHVFSTPAGCPPDATFPCGWPYYRHHFLEAFAVWKSGGFQGLGIYGAIVGGVVGVTLYAVWNHLRPLVWLDLGAPGLAFGQFVGRWGNFINQELYGPPTGSDWFGIKIDGSHRIDQYKELTQYPLDTRFHPTFLYESLWCLFVFLILYNVHARLPQKLRDGDVLLLYLVLYPLGRFFIEMLRPDAWTIGGLAAAQWIAVSCVVGGTIALVLRHVFWNRPEEEPEVEEATT
jgi:phosphatidylglycerol:prolipoprotein diacylglycerol transferase